MFSSGSEKQFQCSGLNEIFITNIFFLKLTKTFHSVQLSAASFLPHNMLEGQEAGGQPGGLMWPTGVTHGRGPLAHWCALGQGRGRGRLATGLAPPHRTLPTATPTTTPTTAPTTAPTPAP